MLNCKLCGGPLTKGNVKVVRKKGKRPVRIHRRCPQVNSKSITEVNFPVAGTAGNGLQRPQDSAGGPFVVEGVFDYPTPTRYRYFVTRTMSEKIQRAIKGGQVGITIEVIPVTDYQVEADPEALANYVEIEFKWKGE